MKKFLINIAYCGLLYIMTLIAVVAARIIAAQRQCSEVFSVPQGTKVLCIGNSHTGCTWYEAAEFKNRVLWTSATGFVTHYMRFREFERRGVLDTGIKYCILDCDGPGMGGFANDRLKKRFVDDLPFAWRYIDILPIGTFEAILYVLCHTSQYFSFDEVPPEQVPDWTTRTKEEQESNIIGQYGKVLADWKTGYPRDWQNTFLELIKDIKMRCEKHGVHLICFAAPLTSASPARANQIIWERESKMIERVKSLGIDYRDFRLSCEDKEFRDSHHLLRNSSYEFTKKFFRDVLKL